MTFNQILTRIDQLYPNGETITVKIDHVNNAQSELSSYFGKYITDESLVTVADQDSYTFPGSLTDVSEIKTLEIGARETPIDRYDYLNYDQSPADGDYPKMYSYHQIYGFDGGKKLCLYPTPLENDFPIRITYLKKLTECTMSTLSLEPEFDPRWHNLLVYYSCYLVCSSGASPDTVQADAFKVKFEEGIEDLWRYRMTQSIYDPMFKRDNKFWHR